MKRSLAAMAGLAVVAFTAVACGSNDKSSSDGKGSSDAYCQMVASFKTDSDKVSALLGADNPDTAALKATFASLKPKVQQLLDEAPAEIKADLQLSTEAQLAAIALFEQYDYDLVTISTSPEYTDLQTKYDTPQQTAASDHLNAWAKDTCGIVFES